MSHLLTLIERGRKIPSHGKFLAAAYHAKDLSEYQLDGHIGSDGAGPSVRLARYGQAIGWGENVQNGNLTAAEHVRAYIIDDGYPSRGHRYNIFNSSFEAIGLAIRPYPSNGSVSVQNFAASFYEK